MLFYENLLPNFILNRWLAGGKQKTLQIKTSEQFIVEK